MEGILASEDIASQAIIQKHLKLKAGVNATIQTIKETIGLLHYCKYIIYKKD